MASPNTVSLSGLSESEAQEFHKFYIQGFVIFTAIAVVAHFLVWMWRPWIPGPGGYETSSLEGVQTIASSALSLLS